MRTVLILCLLLVSLARQGHGNFIEFMKNLPGDISHAFTGAWDSIIDAIKKPVRTKRIGPASRKKALKAMTTTTPYIWTSAPDTDKIIGVLEKKIAEDETTQRAENKLKLPVIELPKSSSQESWIRRPYSTYSTRSTHSSLVSPTTPKPESTTVNTLKFYKEHDADDENSGQDESYIFRPLILL